ncbi:MAG: hypothetical protein ACK41E_12315 [Deinococcales bacterium]
MAIPTVRVPDAVFDAVLESFVFVNEQLMPKSELSRAPREEEIVDRYAFTAFVEALRSEEFFEDPFETVLDLELTQEFESEDAAWEAIKEFYSERACTLLVVGTCEEFIVGDELLQTLGLT